MRDYLLFVDTETSGLPKDWKQPYSIKGNWPYIVQIAWIIYTKEGEEVKTENHFIKDNDFKITAASARVHGITREFLLKNGESRQTVMQCLFEDLQIYKPLVVGHFVKLDFHMLSAGFYRASMENPLKELPAFCTMRAATHYVRFPHRRYPDLGDLYKSLFDTSLEHQHNAMVDASATAKCFFALQKKGDIDEDMIARQHLSDDEGEMEEKRLQGATLFLIVFILITVLWYLL